MADVITPTCATSHRYVKPLLTLRAEIHMDRNKYR